MNDPISAMKASIILQIVFGIVLVILLLVAIYQVSEIIAFLNNLFRLPANIVSG